MPPRARETVGYQSLEITVLVTSGVKWSVDFHGGKNLVSLNHVF